MPIHGNAAVSYGNDCLQAERQPIPWLWDGLIAPEAITLLSAPEKTGKTTLLSLLLDRSRAGGQLLGRAVRPGRTRTSRSRRAVPPVRTAARPARSRPLRRQ